MTWRISRKSKKQPSDPEGALEILPKNDDKMPPFKGRYTIPTIHFS